MIDLVRYFLVLLGEISSQGVDGAIADDHERFIESLIDRNAVLLAVASGHPSPASPVGTFSRQRISPVRPRSHAKTRS